MTDERQPKQPTDHLPPRDEREPDDERTTSGSYPGGDAAQPDERDGVSEATAAEPDKPNRHGVDKLPPGLQ